MGKQINFYIHKELGLEFFNYLKKNNYILFIKKNIRPTNLEFNFIEINNLVELNFENIKVYGDIYICTKESWTDIVKTCINNPDKYIYDILYEFDVIEFSRSFIRKENKEIDQGRLYYITYYYDKNGELIHKNKNLDKLYNKLCRWIRKNVPRTEIQINNIGQKHYISQPLIELINNEKYILR